MLKNKYSATYKSFIKKTVFYIDTGNSPGKITPTEADLRGGGVEEEGLGRWTHAPSLFFEITLKN